MFYPIFPVLYLSLLGVTLASTRLWNHENLCLSFAETPLYLDKGIYIVPLVVQLPKRGCTEEYSRRLSLLIQQLDTPFIPASQFVPNARRIKRTPIPVIIAGLATLFSTISIGSGISNAVRIDDLAKTVSFIESNQEKISFRLSTMAQQLVEMKTEHSNSFLAIKQTAELAKIQSDFNSCQLGLNKIDDIIQSLLTHSLTNHILPPARVLDFLKANPVLRDSLFLSYPHLVYEFSRVELINVDPERQTFSVLVLLPHVNHQKDGRLFTPLHAPRFEVQNQEVVLESSPKLTALFQLGTGPLSPRPLLSMDLQKCKSINHGSICPLTAQFFDDSTHCTNKILRNVTDPESLSGCGFHHIKLPVHQHTSIADSMSHLILFSNEKTDGLTSSGFISLIPEGAPPSCVIINKIQLKSLVVGNKTYFLNLRTDIFELDSEDQTVVSHLMASGTMPFLGTRTHGHLHPFSRHFGASVLAVTFISIIITAMFLSGIWGIRRFVSPKIPTVSDLERAKEFVKKFPPESPE